MILPYEIRLDINSLSVTYEARSTIMTILRYCSILSDTRYCLLSHNCFTHLHLICIKSVTDIETNIILYY